MSGLRPAPGARLVAEGAATDLAAGIARCAAALAARSVGRGDRVAFLGQNHPSQIVLLFACARLGAVQVPLNWRLAAPELRFILKDSGSRLLLATPAFAEAARQAAPDGCGVLDATASPPEAPDAPAAGTGEDALLLVYTSGTTGRPKGAVLTQDAVSHNAAASRAIFGMTAADRVLTVLPLFHVGGLNIQTVPALLAGAAALLHPRFEPDAFFDAVERERPSLTLVVPAVMQALVAHPRWAAADLSALRAVGAGSSEVPIELIEAFHAKGVPVQQVYGATETCPIAIAQTREEALAAPGSIGRPAPGVEARLAPGTCEIEVRGPNVMRGYWRAPEATAAALKDGWFATGDVGRVDAAGRWWFTDRLKHVIVSGGENIYPAEVERVLRSAPGVAECTVLGRPDPRWGEVPVAVVVPGSNFEAEAVLRHCEGRLARFKHPRAVVTVTALPRTALGKVQLGALGELVRSSG
jgi:acyl-CoA synthetase (AMP-forming)/AMP-acid ligase II